MGKAEGMVDLVSDFLRRRFGKLPDWALRAAAGRRQRCSETDPWTQR